MRLVSYIDRSDASAGIQTGALIDGDRRIVGLSQSGAHPALRDMQSLIESGQSGLDAAREIERTAVLRGQGTVFPAERARLLAPVPVPQSIRDWGSFPEHAINMRRVTHQRLANASADPVAAMERFRQEGKLDLPADYDELPRYHACNRFSVVGTGVDIECPPFTSQMDFELEFGIFIGQRGKNIPPTEAPAYIFGYTAFNDMTARDFQRREGRIGGRCKEFDTGNVMGPCLVTADELPDPYSLRMRAFVNGEVWSDASSSTMHRRFADLISYMSQCTTLHPGEFFGSGTVGTGCGAEFDRYLKPGDLVEIEIEGIGRLSNRLVPAGPGQRS